MTFAADDILASYRACRRLSGQAGSNFPAAFCLLPPAKRQAMHALYAFMRHSDDLADDPPPGCSARDLLRQWRTALTDEIVLQVHERVKRVDKVLGEIDWQTLRDLSAAELIQTTDKVLGAIRSCAAARQTSQLDPPLTSGATSEICARGPAILPAVAHTILEFHIPLKSLFDVLAGVEMDLEPRVYATFDELAVYCERVASAVGLACIHIWGFSGHGALGPCRSAGLALQLTNILRDLGEDARRGRIYLPLDDLRACGYTAEELQQGVVNQPFLRLMEMEIDRAEQFYREAAELPRWLHKDGLRIFGLMMDTYHALLDAIRRRPADVFSRQIRVSRWKKAWLAARWSLLPVKKDEG